MPETKANTKFQVTKEVISAGDDLDFECITEDGLYAAYTRVEKVIMNSDLYQGLKYNPSDFEIQLCAKLVVKK